LVIVRLAVYLPLLAPLDARERQIVLAHEHAHLAERHYVFLALADLAAATNPLLRPVADAVHFSTERWADEHAAQVAADRELGARTVGKAALLTWHHPTIATMAIGGPLRRRRPVGPVPRRVLALLAPPVRSRPLLVGVTVAAVLLTGAAGVEAWRDALFELARAA
jgi:beta-lactamase regulating signal transducer with metallopeptidase domain